MMSIVKFAGVCLIKNKKILLVQESHTEALGLWSLPLGYVEDNEKETKTAQRETKEETGYDVALDQARKIKINGIDLKSTSNFNNNQIELTIFKARIIGGELSPGHDIMAVQWFSLDQINTIPLRGEWIKYFIQK